VWDLEVMVETKRLYRSRTDKMIAGVCGGLANYFGLDPVLVRVIWVVAALSFGAGLLAYILLWLFVPQESITA
jgi:phage shock protein C